MRRPLLVLLGLWRSWRQPSSLSTTHNRRVNDETATRRVEAAPPVRYHQKCRRISPRHTPSSVQARRGGGRSGGIPWQLSALSYTLCTRTWRVFAWLDLTQSLDIHGNNRGRREENWARCGIRATGAKMDCSRHKAAYQGVSRGLRPDHHHPCEIPNSEMNGNNSIERCGRRPTAGAEENPSCRESHPEIRGEESHPAFCHPWSRTNKYIYIHTQLCCGMVTLIRGEYTCHPDEAENESSRDAVSENNHAADKNIDELRAR